MIENIDTLVRIEQDLSLIPLEETLESFSNVANDIGSMVTDPQVLDLLSQIHTLLQELSALTF